MKPVFQTEFRTKEGGKGNCLRAVVASILEIGIEEIDEPVCDFLENRGMTLKGYWHDPGGDDYLLAIGPSLAGPWKHAVVWHRGKVAHNPNPKTGPAGIEFPEVFFRIVPKNPD